MRYWVCVLAGCNSHTKGWISRIIIKIFFFLFSLQWSNFSLPELNNFLKVLDREQDEHINQLQYKYRMMKKVILQRLKEIRKCRNDVSPTSPSAPTGNGNHSPGGQTQKVIQWPTNCTQRLHVRAQICMNMCVSVVRSVCVCV